MDYWFEHTGSSLTLHFTLPVNPAEKIQTLELAVYDPAYLVDFTFAEKDPLVLSKAPKSCKFALSQGHQVIVGPGQSAGEAYYNQVESKGYGWQFASNASVRCSSQALPEGAVNRVDEIRQVQSRWIIAVRSI